MAAFIRCIRDTVTNELVYVNIDAVKYFDANITNKRVSFHFAKGESVTVKESTAQVLELISQASPISA